MRPFLMVCFSYEEYLYHTPPHPGPPTGEGRGRVSSLLRDLYSREVPVPKYARKKNVILYSKNSKKI